MKSKGKTGVVMRRIYFILVTISLAAIIAACSQSPVEPVVAEEPPSFYVPDWISGKSLVLSYTWIDTSGSGDIIYSGSVVSTAGRIDSVWFNFPQRCDQDLDFTIIADSLTIENDNPTLSGALIVHEGSILSGRYSYGFEVNQIVDRKSTYRIEVTPSANLPAPVMAYLRIEY
jgi:hypothetical protein